MTMLNYQKIKVPNYDIMRNEILKFVQPQITENLRYWDIPRIDAPRAFPLLCEYIVKNFYSFPILFRFYNSPPFSELSPHVDNVSGAANQIGFNIPVLGTSNTRMNYYDTPSDNIELQYTGGFGGLPTQLIKDITKLVLTDSIEIDEPTLLRTDKIHEVVNNKETNRLILGMKFIGTTFEEVFKFKND